MVGRNDVLCALSDDRLQSDGHGLPQTKDEPGAVPQTASVPKRWASRPATKCASWKRSGRTQYPRLHTRSASAAISRRRRDAIVHCRSILQSDRATPFGWPFLRRNRTDHPRRTGQPCRLWDHCVGSVCAAGFRRLLYRVRVRTRRCQGHCELGRLTWRAPAQGPCGRSARARSQLREQLHPVVVEKKASSLHWTMTTRRRLT